MHLAPPGSQGSSGPACRGSAGRGPEEVAAKTLLRAAFCWRSGLQSSKPKTHLFGLSDSLESPSHLIPLFFSLLAETQNAVGFHPAAGRALLPLLGPVWGRLSLVVSIPPQPAIHLWRSLRPLPLWALWALPLRGRGRSSLCLWLSTPTRAPRLPPGVRLSPQLPHSHVLRQPQSQVPALCPLPHEVCLLPEQPDLFHPGGCLRQCHWAALDCSPWQPDHQW